MTTTALADPGYAPGLHITPLCRGEIRGSRPIAVGFARRELCGDEFDRHVHAVREYAHRLGYRWVYPVHPPAATPDPIAYALHIAGEVNATAIVAPDLEHVNHRPGRIRAELVLATVDPPIVLSRTGCGRAPRAGLR